MDTMTGTTAAGDNIRPVAAKPHRDHKTPGINGRIQQRDLKCKSDESPATAIW